MRINKDRFYQQYIEEFVSIESHATVHNLNIILTSLEEHDYLFDQDNHMLKLCSMSYILATIRHESYDWRKGVYYSPIKEVRASTKQKKLRKMQDRYWNTGYYGRGLIQLTWKENYVKARMLTGQPLVGRPSLLLEDMQLNCELAIKGMLVGLYTGKKLDDYINVQGVDFIGARRIINGTDKAEEIAAVAISFHKILGYSVDKD